MCDDTHEHKPPHKTHQQGRAMTSTRKLPNHLSQLFPRNVELSFEDYIDQKVTFTRDKRTEAIIINSSDLDTFAIKDFVTKVNNEDVSMLRLAELELIFQTTETWPMPVEIYTKRKPESLRMYPVDCQFKAIWGVLSKAGWNEHNGQEVSEFYFRFPKAKRQRTFPKPVVGVNCLDSEEAVVAFCFEHGIDVNSTKEEVLAATQQGKDEADEPVVTYQTKKKKNNQTVEEKEEKPSKRAKKQEEEEEEKPSKRPNMFKRSKRGETSAAEEEEVELTGVENVGGELTPRYNTRRSARLEARELTQICNQIDEASAVHVPTRTKGEREAELRLKLPRFLSQIPVISRAFTPPKPQSTILEQQDSQIDLTLSSDSETEQSKQPVEHVVIKQEEKAEDEDEVQIVASITYQRGQIVSTRYGIASVRYDYDSAHHKFLELLFLWDMRQQIFPFGFISPETEQIVDCTKQVVLHRENMNRSDLARLWPGMYLNDTLINYFLMHIVDTQLAPALRDRVHVMTTHFFSKLTSKQMRDVRTWTKHVDIFSKDFIIVPVNEATHWSLAIICFPGELYGNEFMFQCDQPVTGEQEEYREVVRDLVEQVTFKEETRTPVILKLDSTKGHLTTTVAGLLRKWLAQEWEWKKSGELKLTAISLPVCVPEVPLQDNGCDCGVFLLAFAKHFLTRRALQFQSSEYKIKQKFKQEFGSGWFPQREILEMREGMYKFILQEHEKEQM